MSSIAIVGAGGFIGASLVESLVLEGNHSIRAVVRAPRNLASLCRLGSAVECRFCNAEDASALVEAFGGVDAVVNVTTGPPASIVRSTEAIYAACLRAHVKRLVHLSSAVVYGDVLSPINEDDAPPLRRLWMPYARAKARAENWLRPRIGAGEPAVAVLRPGIVWGVRSPHTIDLAAALAHKSAFLVDGGRWVFNGIYIDNLVAAIHTCCTSKTPISGYYNVADAEHITWREFYAALAGLLGFDPHELPAVSGERFPWSRSAMIDYVQSLSLVNALYHRLKSRIPDGVKAALKARLADAYDYRLIASRYSTRPRVDRELWHLQRIRHKLPIARSISTFGLPPVSFAAGAARTIAWLASLGYGAHPRLPAFHDSPASSYVTI